jgi:RecA-family ATPase
VSPPGCNKTFLALDLSLSIASAQATWLGHQLHVGGPVVYVLGEGGGRFKTRVLAWDEHHGIAPSQSYPFHVVSEAVALTNSDDANAFVREVAPIKPVLIVFDTLSRCLAGADENNQKDMSTAIAVFDTLRKQLGCAVLFLHHTTKDGGSERGSSVLRGAVDTILMLKVDEPSKPNFTLWCDRQKDAEPFAPIHLAREQVTLASERDPHTGDPVMSCVVKVVPATMTIQEADKRLWQAQRFMRRHANCTRNDLAAHLGGKRQKTLAEINGWVSRGELSFRAGSSDPIATLNAEVSQRVQ